VAKEVPATAAPTAAPGPVTLNVYDPTGAFQVTSLFAPRLADLNGKTICEMSDKMWQDFRTFPLIRGILQKQFPTAKFIPYTEIPMGIDSDEAANLVKANGCQAVIVGNAG
jgi:hypothetical protein